MIYKDLKFTQQKKLPLILQSEITECGHACLAMICQFWGHAIDLFALRHLHTPSSDGMTLKDMHHIIEPLGFKTRALRVPISELSFIACPAILHWNMNHFVVLKKVKKKYAIIHDPAYGVRHCCLDEFSQSFTGIVLEVEKSSDFTCFHTSKKFTLYTLIKTIVGYKKGLTLLLILSFMIEVLNLIHPIALQYITDHMDNISHAAHLITLGSGLLLLMFIHMFTEYIRNKLVLYISTRFTEACSSNIFKHLLSLPLNFFEQRHVGDIQSKFQSIDHIQRKINIDFINTCLDGLMMIMYAVVLNLYSPTLLAVVMTVLMVQSACRWHAYHFIQKNTASSLHLHAKVASIFLESVQAIRPIKAFLKENLRFQMWRHAYIDALNIDLLIANRQIIYQSAYHFLSNIEYFILLGVGAHLIHTHTLSLGMLLAALSTRLILVNKAHGFLQSLFDYQLLSVSLERLSDLLMQKSEAIHTGPLIPQQVHGALKIHDLSFQYTPQSAYIFQHIHLEIAAGEKIAIIGPSGCGKSTFLKVLMGLLPHTEGQIYLDEQPMNTRTLTHYRSCTAAVMQDDVLLHGSLSDNITFFHEEIDHIWLYEVAKIAQIHDHIQTLPMGYETMVHGLGSNLSGGQKQRILLARALYKKPKILFLDEATSHLDQDNEYKMNQELKKLNITQVIVAHRQETIRMADQVVNFEDFDHQ